MQSSHVQLSMHVRLKRHLFKQLHRQKGITKIAKSKQQKHKTGKAFSSPKIAHYLQLHGDVLVCEQDGHDLDGVRLVRFVVADVRLVDAAE